jgi:hypothetical protein
MATFNFKTAAFDRSATLRGNDDAGFVARGRPLTAAVDGGPVMVSGPLSDRLVHALGEQTTSRA